MLLTRPWAGAKSAACCKRTRQIMAGIRQQQQAINQAAVSLWEDVREIPTGEQNLIFHCPSPKGQGEGAALRSTQGTVLRETGRKPQRDWTARSLGVLRFHWAPFPSVSFKPASLHKMQMLIHLRRRFLTFKNTYICAVRQKPK